MGKSIPFLGANAICLHKCCVIVTVAWLRFTPPFVNPADLNATNGAMVSDIASLGDYLYFANGTVNQLHKTFLSLSHLSSLAGVAHLIAVTKSELDKRGI